MTDQNPVPPDLPPVNPRVAPPSVGLGLTSIETILVVLGSLATTWVVPLVLWLVWKDTEPVKARESVKIGVLVAVASVLMWCCVMSLFFAPAFYVGMFGSMAGY